MKKLKSQYRHYINESNKLYAWVYYPSIRSGMHKHFSTKQEKSYYFLHLIEVKGYPIKLRARRGRALASAWDDLPSIVCDLGRSWKHNSKRRKQYYK
ncbi:hypothetical protein GCM10007916_00460 [Psychromonas marina]|uniref:Uncharacterized protein n=1 Tax=Psychromonas marina TaxID=88364 RepID=A0ABQ6DV77_9GAMM|nr:hypothetical protein [Psychromonas marina]GLS88979.1 hypothetical protein GCM10007916_00460 [Psychromonas marina]